MHTLQHSGNEGHSLGQLLNTFAALSLLQVGPCPPLQADWFVGPPAPPVQAPVTLCVSQSKHLGSEVQTPVVPESTTLTKPLPQIGAVKAGCIVGMKMKRIWANATLPAAQTVANGANVTAGVSVEGLLRARMRVEKRDLLQAGTTLEGTLLWAAVNVKHQALLKTGIVMDETVQCTAADTGLSAMANTKQSAGQNQAGDISEFVAAASALDSWMGWFLVKFLWCSSPPCSRVPVEEGTA